MRFMTHHDAARTGRAAPESRGYGVTPAEFDDFTG
jgi:hypothetical protein